MDTYLDLLALLEYEDVEARKCNGVSGPRMM